MDWKLCLICQKATKEVLKCPLNASGSVNLLTPYETFLERSTTFRELNRLPVHLGHLGENVTIEDLGPVGTSHVIKNLTRTNLIGQKGRVGNEMQGVDMKRTCPQRQLFEKFACILCGEDTDTVHEFRTFDADVQNCKMLH